MNFNLVRREPTLPFVPFNQPLFREMEEMSDRLNRLFGTWTRPYDSEIFKNTEWMPPVDVEETETEYLVKAELPEIDKKDVHVTFEAGLLTIQGERQKVKEEKGKKFHRLERSYGTFCRTFALPTEIEPTKITAEFHEGVLKVHLPKTEKAHTKAIEVKVAS